MTHYRALAEALVPVTEALVDSTDTCTLCGNFLVLDIDHQAVI